MYRLTVNNAETYWIVMRNVFSSEFKVHLKFDLKGSTVDRAASDKEKVSRCGCKVGVVTVYTSVRPRRVLHSKTMTLLKEKRRYLSVMRQGLTSLLNWSVTLQ